MTAIAPWFGSKRSLAPRIVAEMGEHSAYWEPFCGSMAVLLQKPKATYETVCDLHGDLTNLALVLQSAECEQFYARTSRTIMAEALYKQACQFCRAPLEPELSATERVERAYWFFLKSWLGRGGCAGARAGESLSVLFKPAGPAGGARFRAAVESIPDWHERLRNVLILRRNAFDIIERIDDVAGVAIYCDPPYLVKNGVYAHDFEDADHLRLAELLSRFRRARVVVSYYEHPRLAELYPGWTKVSIEVSRVMARQGRRPNDLKATECLLINGPSRTEGGLFAATADELEASK